jgi:hypothetical protein
MTSTFTSLSRAAVTGRRKIATTIIALTLPFAASAQSSTQPSNPPAGWMEYGQQIVMTTSRDGYPDWALQPGALSTQNQTLTTNLNLTIYKNAVPTNDGYDWYLVTGPFSHAVTGGGDFSNWLSVGIYGTQMNLVINGNGAYVWDYGPSSTVNSTSAGFSVGASIGAAGGDSGGPNGSANFSYSYTNTAPDVQFAGNADSNKMTVTTYLPTPNSGRANPEYPSSTGYIFYSAVVFRVLQGSGLELTVTSSTQWEYDFVRGTPYELYMAWTSGVFNVDFTKKQIVQNTSNLCLGVQGGVLQNSQAVTLQTCDGSAGQSWSYTAASQLQNGLSSTANPYCLDSNNSSQKVAVGMVVSVCVSSKPSQKFKVGQTWQLDQYLNLSKEQNQGRPSIFGGFVVDSPTSFTNEPATYDVYPTGSPTSSVIETLNNLLVSSGATTALGTQVSLQNPLANSGMSGVTYDDTLNVQNHFFTLK